MKGKGILCIICHVCCGRTESKGETEVSGLSQVEKVVMFSLLIIGMLFGGEFPGQGLKHCSCWEQQ